MWLLGLCLSYCIANCAGQITRTEKLYIPDGSPEPPIPCVGLKPDEKIRLLYWYKGDTLEEALNTVLVRYENRPTGETNFTASGQYLLTKDFDLVIMGIEAADTGRFWCRFVRSNMEQSQDYIDVIVVLSSELVLSPCNPSEAGACDVDKSSRLIIECSVTNAFPMPSLTWSFTGCSDNQSESQQWFVSNQRSSFDEDARSYNVSSEIYLGELEIEEDARCFFECLGTGHAIVNGSSVATVVVAGKKDIRPTDDRNACDNDNHGNDEPTSGPNLGVLAVIIVLAFLSMVCLIGIVYLVSRVWCPKNGAMAVREDIEMSRHVENHDEKMCLLNAETDKGDSQDITGEMTRWKYKGRLSKKSRGDPLHGVTDVLPSSAGGLILATQSGLQCFSSTFASISAKEDLDLSEDNIISLASYPNSDSVVVGMEKGGLVFVNVMTGKTKSVFPNEVDPDSQFSSSQIAVDDVGAIFTGERNDKAIYMFEPSTACVKKFKIEIHLVNLTAYGSKHVFVSNGKDVIQKYHFNKSQTGYEIMKFKNRISVAPIGSFGIRQITVHAGLLYAVNSFDTGCKIMQYDVETFDILQTFTTSLSDLRGLCFFGEFKVALYETNSVKIYEKEDTDKMDSYVIV